MPTKNNNDATEVYEWRYPIMARLTKLGEVLLDWKEQKQRGNAPSIDALCQSAPELKNEAQNLVRALEAMDHALQQKGRSPPSGAVRQKTRYDALTPGSELVAGYVLVQKLGQGGCGEVWKAKAPNGNYVALKVIVSSRKISAVEHRSLDLLNNIRHPNLLTPFASWQLKGFLIIGMELADRTLFDRFCEAQAQGNTGIPPEELLQFIRQAATGIDFLNSPQHDVDGRKHVSIQHRDIKPQNILLKGKIAKLGDFGLVRLLDNTITEHTGSLTMAYASPEFFNGQTSRFSDQYSLAVTYCQLRGGRLPFTGSAGQIMSGHLLLPPDLSMLPEEDRFAVQRALAKEPKERWPSCAEFVDAITAHKPSQSGRSTNGDYGGIWNEPFSKSVRAGLAKVMSTVSPRLQRIPKRWLLWSCLLCFGFGLLAALTFYCLIAGWISFGSSDESNCKSHQKKRIAKVARFSGDWKIGYTNGLMRDIAIAKDGTVRFEREKLQGKIKRENDMWILAFKEDPRLERLTLDAKGILRVEHYNPRAGAVFPTKPNEVGFGVRANEKANGFQHFSTLDCGSKPHYPFQMGKSFNFSKDWRFMIQICIPVTKLVKNEVFPFFWGDSRPGRDALFLRQIGTSMDAAIGDTASAESHVVRWPIREQSWVSVELGYAARTKEVELFVDGKLIKRERSKVVPRIDRPASIFLGSRDTGAGHFHGKVQMIWLGNVEPQGG